MSQKYIAQWAWGHNETLDGHASLSLHGHRPGERQAGLPGFAFPTNLYPDNGGKPVYRIRPRYNSEYVWNRAGLEAIGGLKLDYHTKPLWIIQP